MIYMAGSDFASIIRKMKIIGNEGEALKRVYS